MNKHINSIEIIRVFACLGVVLGHFRGAFLPNINSWFRNTPLELIFGGSNSVRILFTISGFVISVKYFQRQCYEQVPVDILKRWFRLMPAILTANIMVYFLMKEGMFFNIEAANISGSQDFLGSFNTFSPNFKECLYDSLIGYYLYGKTAYIAPLWTMRHEFMGSILVLAVIGIFKNNRLRFLYYIIQLYFFAGERNYYCYFIMGMLVCDICHTTNIIKIMTKHQYITNSILLTVLIAFSMIKGHYWLFLIEFFVLIICMMASTAGEKLSGNKFILYISKHSFTIYLIHWPVYETFSSWYYVKFFNVMSQKILIASDFIISIIIISLLSWFLTKYIENLGRPAAKWLSDNYDKLFEKA